MVRAALNDCLSCRQGQRAQVEDNLDCLHEHWDAHCDSYCLKLPTVTNNHHDQPRITQNQLRSQR